MSTTSSACPVRTARRTLQRPSPPASWRRDRLSRTASTSDGSRCTTVTSVSSPSSSSMSTTHQSPSRGTTSDGTRCITVRGSSVAIRIGLASDSTASRSRAASASMRHWCSRSSRRPRTSSTSRRSVTSAAMPIILIGWSRASTHGAAPHLEPALLAVHAHDADLVVEVLAGLRGGDDLVAVLLAVVGVDDLGERERVGRERVRVDAEDVGEGARPHDLVAQEVPVPAAEAAGGQGEVEPGEAVGEAAGAAALLGDLGQHEPDAEPAPGHVVDRERGDLPVAAAVRARAAAHHRPVDRLALVEDGLRDRDHPARRGRTARRRGGCRPRPSRAPRTRRWR